MDTNTQYNVISALPKMVGGYRYQHCRLNFPKKPNWFHRTMMKLFFGFVWEDG